MCIAGVWDLQTTTFEIPWFLGYRISPLIYLQKINVDVFAGFSTRKLPGHEINGFCLKRREFQIFQVQESIFREQEICANLGQRHL